MTCRREKNRFFNLADKESICNFAALYIGKRIPSRFDSNIEITNF